MGKSNALTWALGVGLVVALLVIAFLLGRSSQPQVVELSGPVGFVRTPSGPPTEQVPAQPAVEPVATPDPVAPMPAAPAHATAVPAPAAPAPAPRSAEPRAADPVRADPPAAARPTASDLRDYFARIDAIQVGPQGTDPQAFANELLAASMSGDTSRFDKLVQELSAAHARISALVPPPEAQAHHRALLAQTAQARDMLTKVGAALAKRDPSALSSMADEAQRMQSAAQVLEQEEKALRAKL